MSRIASGRTFLSKRNLSVNLYPQEVLANLMTRNLSHHQWVLNLWIRNPEATHIRAMLVNILKILLNNLCHNPPEGPLPPKNFRAIKTLSQMKRTLLTRTTLKTASMLLRANPTILLLQIVNLLIQTTLRRVVQKRQSRGRNLGNSLRYPLQKKH
jgi:hypothetical protein